jgi:two-component system, NarL family, sensor histidine kinase BarA
MSYRTFKKLMGETSLERKCRFLFGTGLLLLITGSFYFYAYLNASLFKKQTERTARKFVASTLARAHWKTPETQKSARKGEAPKAFVEDPVRYFQASTTPDVPFEGGVYRVDNPEDRSKRLPDGPDYEALKTIRNSDDHSTGVSQIRKNEQGTETFWYYQGIYAAASCIRCHEQHGDAKEGELIGIARIGIPQRETNRELDQNNMVLLALAIVTAFLAMLAAYVIVRYVIVKPVLHLKDVSDGIARGTLDLRADIRTGDEFEELSHAFNRMLRHLVTVQDELREVNTDLDGKVDELAQVNLQLYEMNKLKDEFLATMSHELRTPLNSILGFSDILENAKNLDEKQKRYVHNIRLSGEDLMARINDVLDLAKIESGRMQLQPIEFSLLDLIERQVGSLMPLAEKKNIDLSEAVATNIPPIYQDYGKVQQILTNLLSNAIKFTPEGGRVRVQARRHPDDEEMFLLIVDDTGIGIRLEEQESIFEKFRQGKLTPGQEDAMTREYGGTGLGLSIVKELSKLLGGEVSLESEFGKGSTFTVQLPFRMPEVKRELTPDLAEEWNTLPRVTVAGAPTAATESNGDDPPLETAADQVAGKDLAWSRDSQLT